MNEKIKKLKEIIDGTDNLVFFGGAGVSTESGIPDFRSTDGLYSQKYDFPPETIVSHTFFMKRNKDFFDFYKDKTAWEIEDEYMFGPDILVAPVMEENTSERKVYLPEGAIWTDANTKKAYSGGQNVTVPAPLDIIPVFIRDNKKIDIYL